ncbi:MAG: SPFH domain-containing protein [Clostridia bacterium]|nr:SPFH domain-containing protein [Clostridia bacterium]
MGLILAAIGAVTGNLADQWKEYFVCDALPADVLVKRGGKQVTGRSSNHGDRSVISNGSGVVVHEGQCVVIVENGKVVEICSEPGNYTYNNQVAPSIFTGNLSEALKETGKDILNRFKAGGATGKDQRVYYFNTKEITGNKFGTPNPVPFRVVDNNIGLDIDLGVRASGMYSYRMTDPILFYTNVCGDVTDVYTRDMLDEMLKAEFKSKLTQGLGKLSPLGLRPSELINHNEELEKAMAEVLTEKWSNERGISLQTVVLESVTLSDDDAERLKNAQNAGMLRNPGMANATLTQAGADALRGAANNPNGSMAGFMGVGMAMNAFQGMAGQVNFPGQGNPNAWLCSCGMNNVGNFCSNCGQKRP